MAEQRTWWKEAVIYQIFPRSFADSNGDGIGDLNGITERLPYLAKLGIDVIWLSPVYASPNDDMGYDISDYQAIMEDFGTMEDFDRMLETAHGLGIKIVMDLVANHTSDEHRWFEESRSSRDNPYRDFYYWRDGKVGPNGEKLPPNNWGSVFSGPAWEYDEATDQWYLENPKVRDEIYRMMRWWCDKGIDGWRMDVITMISKIQSLPDGEVMPDGYGSFVPYVVNGPRVHEFLKEMNREVLSRYDLLTVGEAGGVTIDEAKKYAAADGSELSMVFQFEHMDAGLTEPGPLVGKWGVGKASMPRLREILNKWQLELEGSAWNSLYWNNHDQPRVVSRFGDDRPMLTIFLPGKDFWAQWERTPQEEKEYLSRFRIGTCQVNDPITPVASDGWGYRNMSGGSSDAARFVCPNSGVPPQDWARVGPGEWRRRVRWCLQAREYAVLGTYDDTCDSNFWGIADVSGSTEPAHRNDSTLLDPWAYYNIVCEELDR